MLFDVLMMKNHLIKICNCEHSVDDEVYAGPASHGGECQPRRAGQHVRARHQVWRRAPRRARPRHVLINQWGMGQGASSCRQYRVNLEGVFEQVSIMACPFQSASRPGSSTCSTHEFSGRPTGLLHPGKQPGELGGFLGWAPHAYMIEMDAHGKCGQSSDNNTSTRHTA